MFPMHFFFFRFLTFPPKTLPGMQEIRNKHKKENKYIITYVWEEHINIKNIIRKVIRERL